MLSTIRPAIRQPFGQAKAFPISPDEGVGGLLPAPLLDLQAASDTGTFDDDDITADDTPDFDLTFAGGLVAGDMLRVLDGEDELTLHEITPEEVAGGVIALGLSALAVGEHTIKARLERGARVGEYGEITITITASPP